MTKADVVKENEELRDIIRRIKNVFKERESFGGSSYNNSFDRRTDIQKIKDLVQCV